MRVADAVGRALVALGVDTAFGVIGSGNFHLANALRDAGATFVHARHECAAVCMADAHARVSRGVGVATVHQGPGVTNAMTGLAEAAKARTPLLLLAADTSTGAVRSNFVVDQAGLAACVGAGHERLEDAATALDVLARAHRRATQDRRAVLVSMPLDVQAAHAPDAVPPGPPDEPAAAAPDPADVAALADAIVAARRPAIVAGRGAVLAGAREPLERLADQIGAVLATSANGHGLFAGNPFAVGIAGGFAAPTPAQLLSSADLLLAFGASLNMWTTRHGALVGADTTVVQVDVDPGAIGAHRPADLGIAADAATVAAAVVAELERRDHQADGFRTEGLADQIAQGRWQRVAFDDATGRGRIDPRRLTVELDRLLPAERTVVIDSGHFMGWPAMYLDVPDPAGFVFTQAFQSIGLGLATAIGAAVARPDRVTVAAVGDGGLMMALGEMETAARLRLPLLVVVYDDGAYGAEVHHFGPQGDPVDLVRFGDVDAAAAGRAAGGYGVTVRAPDDLRAVASWLERRDRPLVLDAKVAPDVVADWLEEAFRAH